MGSSFIGEPSNFKHMEGNSVDFKKTFDLNGTDNDEMLRLYLRKAGLSDEIEYLSPEQRRAFIYDIIKSNKMPGYWVPSTMKSSLFAQTPPAVRPPPPPTSMHRPSTNSPLLDRRPEASSPQYATMSTSSSTSSLQSLPRESPIMPHRFAQPSKSPGSPGPPSPSSFGTGRKFEISGPTNFRHIAGDMTRDMTRNAFDLSRTMNDNVLKKYLIERGIREEDISGMRKEDLIRNIVQSKYTWMPPRKSSTFKPEIKYATISSNSRLTLPPPPPAPTASVPPSPTPSTHSSDMLSNYSLITARFADPSQFPAPESLYSEISKPEPPTVVLPPLPPQAQRPAPPPRKSKTRQPLNETPPPPSAVTATPTSSSNIYSTIGSEGYYAAPSPREEENVYSTPTKTRTKPKPNKMPANRDTYVESSNNNSYEPMPQSYEYQTSGSVAPPPPPPPMPQSTGSSGAPPPPPPPSMKQSVMAPSSTNNTRPDNSRDAFLESIRNGVPLKKMNKKAATVGPVKPKSVRKPISTTYQMPQATNSGVPPPPPPPGAGGVPPPPPPPMQQSNSNNINPTTTTNTANSGTGDPRDAFLESIRKGVALKKVDQKAATVSGARTRAERKPPVTDFLSELKMGITLRRVKLSGDDDTADDDGPEETDA